MDRQRIFVTHQLFGNYLTEVLADKYEIEVWPQRDIDRAILLEKVRGCVAIVSLLTEKMDGEVMEAAGENLRVIANYAVGFDNVDIEEANRRGIVVTNTPGVLTEAVAEHAVTLMMALARRVVEGDRFVRAGKYHGWEPDLLIGMETRGKILGIVGLGRIGRWTGRLAHGLGMKLVYHSRTREEDFELECGADFLELDDLMTKSDVVSLHLPLTEGTKGLIGAEQLSKMKKTAILVNTARGAIVDEEALIVALKQKKIAGAGLDVFVNEENVNQGFFGLDNVVLTPHIASATIDARLLMAEKVAKSIKQVLEGEKIENIVNLQAWPAFEERLKK